MMELEKLSEIGAIWLKSGILGTLMELKDILSISIAFLAVLLTVLTLYFQRKHDRLSVQPIGKVFLFDYEHMTHVWIQNMGTGPLLVRCLRVYNLNAGGYKNTLIEWMPEPPSDVAWTHFTGDITDWAIRPGDCIRLIELTGDPNDNNYAEFRESVRETLKDLRVQVYYQCIYKEKTWLCTRDLDFFAREIGKGTPQIS